MAVLSNVEQPDSPFEKTDALPSNKGFDIGFACSGFVTTDVQPVWIERHEERMNVQRRRDKWEKEKRKIYGLKGSEERREESSSSSDEEDGPEVRMELKPCHTGTIPRLKKKDSTRRPNYKDEIMLTDNIDGIIQQEIPDEDDLKEACAPPSSLGTAQTPNMVSTRAKYVKRGDASVNGLDGSSACSSGAFSPPRINRKWKDSVCKIEGEVEADDSVSVPLAIQSVSISRKLRNDIAAPMDEEDLRVQQEIQEMLRQDSYKGDAGKQVTDVPFEPVSKEKDITGSPISEIELIDEDASELHYSPASSTVSICGTASPQMDDQLAEDIAFIFNNDIPTEESNKSGTKTVLGDNHMAKSTVFTEESNESNDRVVTSSVKINLVKDTDYALNDDFLAAKESNEKISGHELKKLKNSDTAEPDDNFLAENIDFILRENVSTDDESRESISYSSVAVPCEKQDSMSKQPEEDEDGVEYIPLPVDEPTNKLNPSRASVVSLPKKDFNRSSQQKDEQLSKDNVNVLQLHLQGDSVQSNYGELSHPEWKCSSSIHVQKVTEDGLEADVPTAKLNWYGAVPRPKTRNPRRDFVVSTDKSANTIPRLRQKYATLKKERDRVQKNVEEVASNRPVAQSSGAGARPKSNFRKQLRRREDTEMAKAFDMTKENSEVVKIFSVGARFDSGSKQLQKLSSIGRESKLMATKQPGASVLHGTEFRKSFPQQCFESSGRKSESPVTRASSSSIETQKCESASSVLIGDALRPMAATSSKVASLKTSNFSSDGVSPSNQQEARIPRPPSTPRGKTKRPAIFVRPAPDTRLLSKEDRRKAAEQTDCTQKGARTHSSYKHVYDSEELQLMTEIEETYDARQLRLAALNRKAAVPVDNRHGSLSSQSRSFHPVYDNGDQKLMADIEKIGQSDARTLRVRPRRKSSLALNDRSRSMASSCEAAEPAPDMSGHACSHKWTPGIVYTAEELNLMAEIEEQHG